MQYEILESEGFEIIQETVEVLEVLKTTQPPEDIFEIGVQGPPGAPGEIPPGAGGDLAYEHTQGVASDSWVIDHNMGKFPAVQVFDSAGDECEGEVKHLSRNQMQINFSAAMGGVAYLN